MQALDVRPTDVLPVSGAASTADPIIVVGAGPVGIRFAQEVFARGYAGALLLFGDEPWQPYNRVQLSQLLAGETHLDAIANPVRHVPDGRMVQHLACTVTQIDPAQRTVTDDQGRQHRYRTLVLAVGSRAHVPDGVNTSLSGVYLFRNLRDTEALKARTARSQHVVVVGGGLLGLEAARALQRGHAQVTVVHQSARLMNRQLDDIAAERLKQRVEALGMSVLLGVGFAGVVGDTRVSGVRLRDGRIIPCDTVLLATGIRPNTALARRAWIKVGNGILVDDRLQTSAPDVYAIGECIEHDGQTYGLVAPGYEQATVLADVLTGGRARYTGSLHAAQLKVLDLPVASVGQVTDLPPGARLQEVRYDAASQGVYRKLILQHGRLHGVLSLGSTADIRRLQDAVQHRRYIAPWALRRFRRTGQLWPAATDNSVADWPAQTLVCQCMGVSRGTLSAAVLQGCTTVDALAAQTGAGTVCGGCKPLLQALSGASQRSPEPGHRVLALTGLIGLLACVFWLTWPGLSVAPSVQTQPLFERIWNDGFAKQVSGFSLLGLALVGLLPSLRKRIAAFRWGAFARWRLMHVVLGAIALLVLVAHSGWHLGSHLNRWLMLNFLLLTGVGALASLLMAWEHKLSVSAARRSRHLLLWGHILAAWPLPVLLTFHVLSVYYF